MLDPDHAALTVGGVRPSGVKLEGRRGSKTKTQRYKKGGTSANELQITLAVPGLADLGRLGESYFM